MSQAGQGEKSSLDVLGLVKPRQMSSTMMLIASGQRAQDYRKVKEERRGEETCVFSKDILMEMVQC